MAVKGDPGQAIDRVILAHGGGGQLMGRLIHEMILPAIGADAMDPLTDGAVLDLGGGDAVFTTDSYVVTPLEFPGGDIGRLSIAGTVNDLAVMGATPIAIGLGLILEEGLPLPLLRKVMESVGATAREAGVRVVTGDTKVVEKRPSARGLTGGPADTGGSTVGGLFINTSGVGRRMAGVELGFDRVCAGDAVLVNGTIADHGLAVMSVREGLSFSSPLCSDVAPLAGMISDVLASGASVRFLRDATRGGVAGVFADISEATGLSVEVEESSVPVDPTARHAAEMLGLDPLTVANEGKVVCVVAEESADRALEAMRAHPLGRQAARIGCVTDRVPPLVELVTRAGGRRIVQRPYGEQLPRIC